MIEGISRTRLYCGLFVCFFIDLLRLITSYIPLLNMYKENIVSINVLTENLITCDYHTPLSYRVVNVVVFLFFIEYVMQDTRIDIFVRYKNREDYWKKQIAVATVCVFLFTLVYEMISVAFLIVFGNVNVLIHHYLIAGVLFQIIAATLFYLSVYLFYIIMNIRWKRGFAMLITIIFQAIAYYIICRTSIKIEDVALLRSLCAGLYSNFDCAVSLLRLTIWVLLLINILMKLKSKEDMLLHERG